MQYKNTRNARVVRWASQCPAITITLAAFWPSVDNIDGDEIWACLNIVMTNMILTLQRTDYNDADNVFADNGLSDSTLKQKHIAKSLTEECNKDTIRDW